MEEYYFEPSDSQVGDLERRILYLVHKMTFFEYFSRRSYTSILNEHADRVHNAPASVVFPLGIAETEARLRALSAALEAAGWGNDSLRVLFRRQIDPSSAVWITTERVDAAGIFVPYFHARDKVLVEELFSDGFLRDDVGWGGYELHKLFSSRKAGYGNPEHQQRLKLLKQAKTARVIRPISVKHVASGAVILGSKGNQYCCQSGACQWNGDADSYCSAAEGGGCSLISDECP